MSLKTMSPHYRNKMAFVRSALSKVPRDSRILDVGCGYGEYMELFREMGFSNVSGLDTDRKALEGQECVVLCAGESMPFKPSSFDVVTCISVLEHAEDDRRVLDEIRRVLRPGGIAIIVVPSSAYPFTYDPVNAFLRPFGRRVGIGMWAWGHRRLYEKRLFEGMLLRNGFRIERKSQITHAFVTLFMGYGPFLAGSLMRRSFGKGRGKAPGRQPFIGRLYGKLAEIDEKWFSWTPCVEMGFVLRK